MKLAQVALDIKTQALDSAYTYSVPANLESECQVGCAVLVPFGTRFAIGFVLDTADTEQENLPAWVKLNSKIKIKNIKSVETKPLYNKLAAKCALWLHQYYIAPLNACVRLFTPFGSIPKVKKNPSGKWRIEKPAVGEVADVWVVATPSINSFEPANNSVKQLQVVNLLKTCKRLKTTEISNELGSSCTATLKALESRGVVQLKTQRRMRFDVSDDVQRATSSFGDCKGHVLNVYQAKALEVINTATSKSSSQVVLLDGVTGSGKTEVYIQAIKNVVDKGKSAIVLVPEISLTPQTVSRFRSRFGNNVAVIHSKMSAGQRFDEWDFIASGKGRVVVGARSALFTPVSNLGLIVIDEEHENTYKQDQAPRYNARKVAIYMAQQSRATVVLGSATPSIEALHACKTRSNWQHVVLPERVNGSPMPSIRVVDMAAQFQAGNRAMFSVALISALSKSLSAGQKVVLMLNQRGFAKFLLCRECGFVPKCTRCDTSLTYHEHGNFLICHHCGYKRQSMSVCPKCKSPYLRKFGAGTQRVESELRGVLDNTLRLANVPIIRMDADTTKAKGAHARLLSQFANSKAAVLLGTQMIAKGLDFNDVTLVGVINADTQLQLPDFRSAERTFALVQQVAGRAGRAQLEGHVIVQTYDPNAAAIKAAATYDREMFLEGELQKRALLRYPPYVRLANVRVWGVHEGDVEALAKKIEVDLRALIAGNNCNGWEVMPATACVLSRLRRSYRWHVLVKAPEATNMSTVLAPYFRKRKPDKWVNVSVDVDPENLL